MEPLGGLQSPKAQLYLLPPPQNQISGGHMKEGQEVLRSRTGSCPQWQPVSGAGGGYLIPSPLPWP